MSADASRPLVLACGALAGDLRAVLTASGFDALIDVEYLPAHLHNHPRDIVPALEPRLRAAAAARRAVFVAYADCGTGGALDALLAEHRGVQRLAGAHCYDVFAGALQIEALLDAELGTFFLTDFLARHFEALVWRGLGLDRHPELREAYFGRYRRVALLAQTPDRAVQAKARDAAERLGLELLELHVGRERLAEPVLVFARAGQAEVLDGASR